RARALECGAGHRPGADGHHVAGDGRLRNHPRRSPDVRVRGAADHRAYRQSDEGGPREMHRCRRERLHFQTGGYRKAANVIAELAAPLNMVADSTAKEKEPAEEKVS